MLYNLQDKHTRNEVEEIDVKDKHDGEHNNDMENRTCCNRLVNLLEKLVDTVM